VGKELDKITILHGKYEKSIELLEKKEIRFTYINDEGKTSPWSTIPRWLVKSLIFAAEEKGCARAL
jgi:hypothetical protein